MKQLFIILLLLLPMMAIGQRREAKKLYRQGVIGHVFRQSDEAIPYFLKSDSINKARLDHSSKKYYRAEKKIAYWLNDIAFAKREQGNYQEAVRLGTQVMVIRKEILGEEHPGYAVSLDNLSVYYSFLGNYTEAIRLGTQAMEIRKKVLGEESHDYARSLNNLAGYYSDLGNYTEAIRLGTQAMEILNKVRGKKHRDYASSLNNLALYNSYLGNYTEAIRLGTQAMEIDKKVIGEEHRDYAGSLNNLAAYNNDLGNYTEALRLGTQAMEIWKKVLGEEHPDYATSLNNLAGYYSDLGNYTEAIRLVTLAMAIRKKVLGEEHSDYATLLKNLACYYFVAGKNDEATVLVEQAYQRYEAIILKTFASLTTKERSDFWNKYSVFFNKDLPFCAKRQPNSTLKSLAYNGQVLSKGLLLNAELEIQNLIEQQGNEQLKQRYYKLRQDRKTLDELYQLAPAERTMDADSLQKVINNEERILVESSKEIGDYTKNLSIKWKDIQNNLKNKDIAVEFVNYNDTADNEVYIALVLKKGMAYPELVPLFTQDDFAAVKKSEYYGTPKLYNLIWKPLEKYLDGVKDVYFSPSGKLHTIGIEYLTDEQDRIFGEKYATYRLSSTRELALTHTINPGKKAATYGGIRYDTNSDTTTVRGGGATYLKGTKVEAEAVSNLLRSANYDTQAFSDTVATEESFKNLSGSGLSILHIGTHGFYYAEDELEDYNLDFLINEKQSDEDRALSCSGLLFAGANIALRSETRNALPSGEDGILTAKEISRLDFKGLDLVVLSACQSGLGEVTDEGVFGLQRGFKKAGVHTLVMSLWNVSDKPTQMLMTEFFKNLTAGQSKREAFVNAQIELRKKYPHPRMWAAFVMVDGVE